MPTSSRFSDLGQSRKKKSSQNARPSPRGEGGPRQRWMRCRRGESTRLPPPSPSLRFREGTETLLYEEKEGNSKGDCPPCCINTGDCPPCCRGRCPHRPVFPTSYPHRIVFHLIRQLRCHLPPGGRLLAPTQLIRNCMNFVLEICSYIYYNKEDNFSA